VSGTLGAAGPASHPDWLAPRAAVWVFLAFALAYFLAALVRAITATLSPTLSAELALSASDLGLLAAGYFFGFALLQLPLGNWLDRHGPRRVLVAFLTMAVLGCVAFALATSFTGLLAATLPVQWLLPLTGWRGLFWGLAVLLVLAMAVIWRWVPDGHGASTTESVPSTPAIGYRDIARHPFFRQMAPIGFVNYGGLVAVQTLWAGPWMVQVAGSSTEQAAFGLFAINLSMLITFWLWGVVGPLLVRRGLSAERLIAWGLPVSLLVLLAIVWVGPRAGWPWWAFFCVSSTLVSLSQPAVAQALPPQAAGRALSAYNLVIFAGIFCVQWAIGLAVDGLSALGWDTVSSYQGAVALLGLSCLAAYGTFLRHYCRSLPIRPPPTRLN